MRIPTFTFKNDATWMVAFSFAPAVIGVLIYLVIMLIRRLF